MIAERSFANTPGAVTDARRFVVDALEDLDSDTAERAAVMTSELATNSLRHAASKFVVRVERFADEVRVSVEDAGPGYPVMQAPGPRDPTGRGLQIVAALSSNWGITQRVDQTGKRVWFTIGVGGRGATRHDDGESGSAGADAASDGNGSRPRDGRRPFRAATRRAA